MIDLSKLLAFGSSLIPFVLVLTVIVFVHEMGHFLIARYNGVQVKTFSIGYGPEIFGWTDKAGTRWRFSWLPFGGYVMMLGDADPSSTRTNVEGLSETEKLKTLSSKTPLQRIAVAFGGPLMNIIFTLLIFTIVGMCKGLPEMRPQIQAVAQNSVAAACGLQAGDLITQIDDVPIKYLSGMQGQLKQKAGGKVTLHYMRDDHECSAEANLWKEGAEGAKIPVSLLGISIAGNPEFVPASVWEVVSFGVKSCCMQAASLFTGIARSIFGKGEGVKFGGVLSIGDWANKSLSGGFVTFLNFMAMLSLSLAFCNLLPIPVLDGGSIFIDFIVLLRGKPLSPSVINLVYSAGGIVVLSLMLWMTWNDLVTYNVVKSVTDFFKRLFGGG
jgi:regulator of sigma E protease